MCDTVSSQSCLFVFDVRVSHLQLPLNMYIYLYILTEQIHVMNTLTLFPRRYQGPSL